VNAKVPEDAFERYVALGPGRSYELLADRLGVDKRTVSRAATREGWTARLSKIHEEARAATDRRLVSDLQAVRERQLKEARFLQAQALRAMKDATPKEAVKVAAALNIGWKHELLLLGDPTERSELSVEEVTKREIHSLLTSDDDLDEWEADEAQEA